MKAVLVLDEMPNDCKRCELMEDFDEDCARCYVTNFPIRNGYAKKRCPLKEMPYNYEEAFKIACEMLNGTMIGGVNKDYIFEHMMDKDGIVTTESYEEFILEHIDQLAWWRWEDEDETD